MNMGNSLGRKHVLYSYMDPLGARQFRSGFVVWGWHFPGPRTELFSQNRGDVTENAYSFPFDFLPAAGKETIDCQEAQHYAVLTSFLDNPCC